MSRKKAAPPAPHSVTPLLPRRKKVLFSLAALVVVPIFLLALLEAGLRLGGFGYPTSFFLTVRENGTEYLINNDKFGWRFFPKAIARSPATLKFAKAKAPGTYRIFIFGESAALGDPKPAYSMGRYLEVLLRERFPGTQFEVITVAMTAINSHAIVPIARECARLGGDFWVIYMGNNEMAGPFGVNPISGPAAPSATVVRLSLALRATKIGQLAERITERFKNEDAQQGEWAGLKMFREHLVSPGDPKKKTVYANFHWNLHDIVKTGISSGAKVIACGVAANQRDFAPFASIDASASRTNQHYLRGCELQSSNLTTEAAAEFKAALDEVSYFADLHFRYAQVCLELGSNTLPSLEFQAALDSDALPLRFDSAMRQEVHNVFGELGTKKADTPVWVLELDHQLAANLPANTLGDETFFDHVHFTFSGNYRAARLLASEIEAALPKTVTEKRAVNWASAQLCDRALGLTDWNRRVAYEQMWQRQSEAPFTEQSNYTNRIESMVRDIVELRETLTPRAATNARAIYVEAIQKNGTDFRLHENFAEFLEATGDLREAAEQRLAVAKFVPHDPVACYQAGRLLGAVKRTDEAREWLGKALAIRSNFPEAHSEIGRVFANEGEHQQALESYAVALKMRPDDSRVLVQRAHSLAALNRRKEAMDALREAIRVKPDNWEPRYLLGIELAANNDIPAALQQFQEVTRLRPGYAQAHFNLAVALAKVGRLSEAYNELQQTLRIDPNHKSAQEYLAAMEAQRQK
jgi:tetratricopeptide (TPR) repeat protein